MRQNPNNATSDQLARWQAELNKTHEKLRQNVMATHDLLADGMQIMTKPFSMTSFAAKVRAMVEEDPDSEMQAKRLAILVVDDNEEAASSLAMLLDASGHAVEVAHDGRMGRGR